jgi:hypothetical protein
MLRALRNALSADARLSPLFGNLLSMAVITHDDAVYHVLVAWYAALQSVTNLAPVAFEYEHIKRVPAVEIGTVGTNLVVRERRQDFVADRTNDHF